MPRMIHKEHGFMNATESDVSGLVTLGWEVLTEDRWQQILAAKRGIAKPTEEVTITPQRRAGRPRKTPEVPSILNDGESYGNSAESD